MAFDEFIARRFRDLSASNWDRFVRALDGRFLVLEEQLGIQRKVTEAVLQRGLQVIEDELGPVVAEAQNKAGSITDLARDLGLLLRASSSSNLTIGTGAKAFIIAEGERERFAAPLYVIAAVAGAADHWMAGQVTSWDVTTGTLTVSVTNTRGAGSFAAWDITVASIPPEVPPAQTAANVMLAAIAGLAATDVQAGFAELTTQLAARAALDSPNLTGTPTAPTASAGTNTVQIATTAFVKQAIDLLLSGAPGALDTLNELAAALGNDANFAATLTTTLAGKQAASANLNAWATIGQATTAEYRSGSAADKALTVANVWAAWAEVPLAYAATITPNFSSGFDFVITLTGNATLANPTNPKVGQRGRIRIVQDGTGSRTLAYGAYWKFAGSTPSLSIAASSEDFLDYEVVSATRIRAALTKGIPT